MAQPAPLLNAVPPLLMVEGLTMRFGGLIAVNNVSFHAQRGHITALIGPNGAGKTTLFNCLTGFYKPNSGVISLNRADNHTYQLQQMADYDIVRTAKVTRTFQNIRLFSGMTVFENLLVAQHTTLMKASGYSFFGLFNLPSWRNSDSLSRQKAVYWLEKTGLIARADDPAGDLPYGDQRRLEIARAMCTMPELLCLDEPAAGLNPRESADLNALLMSICHEHNTAILLIEHDMSVVMAISDHIVVIDYGVKIAEGTPHHIKNDAKVIAAYLGVPDDEMAQVVQNREQQ